MKYYVLLAIMLGYVPMSFGQKMNIEVDPHATVYAIDSIEINAPAEKVFSRIADINHWPGWFDGVTEAKVNGPVQEGADFVWKARGYKIKSQLHTMRPNSAVGWTGKMWWIKAIHNWHFKTDANGKTMVIVQENFSGLGSSFLRNSVKKDMRHDLIALKNASEKQ
jgi:hypothetical protein